MLNYIQTLDKIERFMIDSGIRKYCTDVCKGRCCENCYTTDNACHKHEKRRLSCSIYLCSSLRRLFYEKDSLLFLEIKHEVVNEYYYFMKKNCYFNPPNDEFLNNSRFPSSSIRKLNHKLLKRIKLVMEILINEKIIIYNVPINRCKSIKLYKRINEQRQRCKE